MEPVSESEKEGWRLFADYLFDLELLEIGKSSFPHRTWDEYSSILEGRSIDIGSTGLYLIDKKENAS